MSVKIDKLGIVVGVLSIVTGLLYVFRLFGPTEAEVVTWGVLAVILGGIVLLLGFYQNKLIIYFKMFLVFFLALIQIPAMILWFLFSGSSISDGIPQSDFVAHWLFALPHLVIVILGIVKIISLLKKVQKDL